LTIVAFRSAAEPELGMDRSVVETLTDAPPFIVRVPPKRAASLAALVVLCAGLAWVVFADPISHVWYQARQHTLSLRAANAGSQVGSLALHPGDPVGVLEDPAIGLNVVIAEGDDPSTLRGAPGHVPGTPLPGAVGNSVVVGHRRDWGGSFGQIPKLTIGDALYLEARPGVYNVQQGQTGYYVYTVISVTTTSDSDTRPLSPSNDHRLTLITNAGSRALSGRVWVVTAVSGSIGHSGIAPAKGSLVPPRGSLLFNANAGSFIVRGAAATALIALLRRRGHRGAIIAAVSAPLVGAALLALLLVLDMAIFRPLA